MLPAVTVISSLLLGTWCMQLLCIIPGYISLNKLNVFALVIELLRFVCEGKFPCEPYEGVWWSDRRVMEYIPNGGRRGDLEVSLTLAPLYSWGNIPRASIQQQAGWASGSIWELWRRVNFHVLTENPITIPLTSSPYPNHHNNCDFLASIFELDTK